MLDKSLAVLFRGSLAEDGERHACQNYFPTYDHRTDIPEDSLVVCRYSCLPYYKELEYDLANRRCKLINSYAEHRWIANFEYYDSLRDLTPETWTDDTLCECTHPGSFVVKGKTNSKKWQWNTMMFAQDKRAAMDIGCELMQDSMIAEQGVIYRKYVPLKTFETGLNGLPFTNEYRLFFYKDTLLSWAYYWSSALDVSHVLNDKGIEFACEVAEIASRHTNFFVLDIAETTEGKWILIEVNDGQMSGLSENGADRLYKKLRSALENNSRKF